MPPDASERVGQASDWLGALPRLADLGAQGAALAAEYRALPPGLRARLLALALQGETDATAWDRECAAASDFVEIEDWGSLRWRAPQHRAAVLAASVPDDHRAAARVRFADPAATRGRALHLLFGGESPAVSELVDAATFFARADRPSWAVHCLVRAAEAAVDPDATAALAAAAANIAAFDGDFAVVEHVLYRFTDTDTRVLLRESAPARALRQALPESDPAAARTTILARLRGDALTPDTTGEALAAYALINLLAADVDAWGEFVRVTAATPASLHPEIVGIASLMTAPYDAEVQVVCPPGADGRGWVQLAASVARILRAHRALRVGAFLPSAAGSGQVANRLVRILDATYLGSLLAHTHQWDELQAAAAVVLASAAHTVPAPLLRVGAEVMLAYAEAFRGEQHHARTRADRLLTEPVLRRAFWLRALLDSVIVMIEASEGNYERAMALLATRRPDVLALTVGAYGPMELFDLVDCALLLHQDDEAMARIEYIRAVLPHQPSERATFVLAACDAVIAARRTLTPTEELLERSESLPFVYESARLRLVYAERLRAARRTAEARRHLLRVELDLMSVQAGAWLSRVRRELRACSREVAVGVADLTEQEARIAELAAVGLSNKEIGGRLYLSPRTVGGHLYRIFPKLGVTTRAQLRDALSTAADAAERG